MITLEDALASGRGAERPFNCPSHADFHASASVNVAKGVWYCYSCSASGRVEGKRTPTDNELEAMLAPEKAARRYPASWSTLFACTDGYWSARFPDWICAFAGFGEDPVDSAPTFPVFTPQGHLAGVGRRSDTDPRYRYPYGWAASRSLGLLAQAGKVGQVPVVALVEGVADGAACWEIGLPAFACYGAGLHFPQRELVARLAPKLILTGFDADDAGAAATDRDASTLADLAEVASIDWGAAGVKDPAELDVEIRRELVLQTVAATAYGRGEPGVAQTFAAVANAVRTAHTNRKE